MIRHPISAVLLLLVGEVLLTWRSLHDDIRCIVSSSQSASSSREGTGDAMDVSGYYVAEGGIYVRRSSGGVQSLPDIFDLLSFLPSSSSLGENKRVIISQDKHNWLLQEAEVDSHGRVRRKVLYRNSPQHSQDYLFQPPPFNWIQQEEKERPQSITVSQCHGSLADSSPILAPHQRSNMAILFARPVTVFILIVIIYIAYVLWSQSIPVSSVAFSYDAVINNCEYWRIVTASFSHFEVLHLAFNTMSFYQLGELEEVYGSLSFFYLNANLVVITMALCSWLYHLLITRADKIHLIQQQAVGYSCVLFAWMVAASVRMSEFCPIFFMPSFCFPTWFVSIPGLAMMSSSSSFPKGLPINFGPFLLLIATKLILPQSSLTGHLSGIIAGFPLAWGLLNWLTPPIAASVLILCYTHMRDLWIWKLRGYSRNNENVTFSEFVPQADLQKYTMLRYLTWGLTAWTCLFRLPSLLLFPQSSLEDMTYKALLPEVWLKMIPHLVLLGMVFMSLEARRCEWLATSRETQKQCFVLMVVTAVLILIIFVCDFATTVGLLTARSQLAASGHLTSSGLTWGVVSVAGSGVLQSGVLAALLLCVQSMQGADSALKPFHLDADSLHKYFRQLRLVRAANPFEGRGQRAESNIGESSRVADFDASMRDSNSFNYAAIPQQFPLEEVDPRQSNPSRAQSEAGAAALARFAKSSGRGK